MIPREDSVDILGVRVDRVDFAGAVARIGRFLEAGGKHLVVTPYSESVVAAQKDGGFRQVINTADLVVPDGRGLLMAAEYLALKIYPTKGLLRLISAILAGLRVGLHALFLPKNFRRLTESVSGVDLVRGIAALAEKRPLKIFLLGGEREDVAPKTAQVLKTAYPHLQVRAEAGPSRIEAATATEAAALIERINQFAPDCLFVAFKPVFQEKWLAANREKIQAKVFMAVGGAFDMISGYKRRAPKFLSHRGLEWLWRLMIEPARTRRIFNAVIVFPWLVFQSKLSST